jgi:hypothetical protein
MSKDYRTLIESAVTSGWSSGCKIGIIYQVTVNGKYKEGLLFPDGSDNMRTANGEHAVLINLSLNACKQFNYVSEYDQFVYDISVKGQPFFGNIPPEMVIDVVNIDTGESFYHLGDVNNGADEFMVETPSSNFVKVKLVSHNPCIIPSKSLASLKVVH